MRFGTMGTDQDIRIDFAKLRKDREDKAKQALAESDADALLLFDMNNIRYTTSTWLVEWARDKLARYVIMPKGGDPMLFDFGSAVAAKKQSCPWIRDRIYPISSTMRGSIPPIVGIQQEIIDFLVGTLKQHGLSGGKIGMDITEIPILRGLQEQGFAIVDGQQIMLDAREVKTPEEVHLLEGAASMVDAAYSEVVQNLQAGIRENELVAIVNDVLYRLGADEVEAVNCVSGPRCSPHPHDFSDRIIRPDEMIFMDVVSAFNGYRTCYYRTFCVGRASQAMRDAYKKCYEWLYAGIEQVKPGNTTADISSVWPTAQEQGFESEAAAFALQFGHGIGLSVWERPVVSRRISLDYPVELKEGMVFALETYQPAADGSGAARIEEECVVTKDGCKVITKYPAEELICVPA